MIFTDNAKHAVKAVVPPRYVWPARRLALGAACLGTRRYCPCCNCHLRRFGAFGDHPRPDALCPVCGALERHRLASLFLRAHSDLLNRLDRVLHVAPERSMERILRRSASVSYVSVDIEDDGAMVQTDLTCMPFRSRSFDGIYCSHVLEHVAEDHRAMNELHRILRPGGWALIQVPILREATFENAAVTDPEIRRRLFGQPDHVRVYGYDFEDRLARARFSVSVEQPQRDLDPQVVARCGLKEREHIFFCTKRC